MNKIYLDYLFKSLFTFTLSITQAVPTAGLALFTVEDGLEKNPLLKLLTTIPSFKTGYPIMGLCSSLVTNLLARGPKYWEESENLLKSKQDVVQVQSNTNSVSGRIVCNIGYINLLPASLYVGMHFYLGSTEVYKAMKFDKDGILTLSIISAILGGTLGTIYYSRARIKNHSETFGIFLETWSKAPKIHFNVRVTLGLLAAISAGVFSYFTTLAAQEKMGMGDDATLAGISVLSCFISYAYRIGDVLDAKTPNTIEKAKEYPLTLKIPYFVMCVLIAHNSVLNFIINFHGSTESLIDIFDMDIYSSMVIAAVLALASALLNFGFTDVPAMTYLAIIFDYIHQLLLTQNTGVNEKLSLINNSINDTLPSYHQHIQNSSVLADASIHASQPNINHDI